MIKNILITIITCFISLIAYCQSSSSKDSATVVVNENNFATLYIYRPKSRKISLASFTINVNDSSVCKIKSNKRYTVKLYKFGTTEFWAKSEYKSTVTMNIEKGKSYYLKCNIKMGWWAESPALTWMDEVKGKSEFENAKDGD
jgi:type 1 fimbria pilin